MISRSQEPTPPQLALVQTTHSDELRCSRLDPHLRQSLNELECTVAPSSYPSEAARWRALPEELVHHVVLQIHSGEPTSKAALQPSSYSTQRRQHVRSASMVCRHWWKTLQRVRFQAVTLSTIEKMKIFLGMLCKPSVSPLFACPGPFVQSIAINLDAAERIDLLLVSTAPRRLKTLRILTWNGWGTSFEQGKRPVGMLSSTFLRLPLLFRSLASLERLVLASHIFPSFRYIARLVSALPRLVYLDLLDVTWPVTLSLYPPSYPCHPPLLSHVAINYRHPDLQNRHVIVDSVMFVVGRPNAQTERGLVTHGELHSLSENDARAIGVMCFPDTFSAWEIPLDFQISRPLDCLEFSIEVRAPHHRVMSFTAQLDPQGSSSSTRRSLYGLRIDMKPLLATMNATSDSNRVVSANIEHLLKNLDAAIGGLSENITSTLTFYLPDWKKGERRALWRRMRHCLPQAIKKGKVHFHDEEEEESIAILEVLIAYCVFFLIFMYLTYWILGYVADYFEYFSLYSRLLIICASGVFTSYCLRI
ncbi:hypothetical protein PHLGIDRAFT_182759 [Phlebiopsis gigantea 11061_1 CR5-6]|uniref:Uncharacterized protein n=1 Tax=Phlebiopsis gigantea (strain 11061_1 CR5-6) TaxID=745531 RepID=A0A0C3RUJ6_PHLG1|nr:hypothetical protein PHLGIDRAFT_182759 [Phlebiopsis gigantea 11061_1 CR5-6]